MRMIGQIILLFCMSGFISTIYGDADTVRQGLDRLLEQVQELRRNDSQLDQQREQKFLKSRDQQVQLLDQAEKEQQRLQAESERFEKIFHDNEIDLQSLETVYRQRVGNLVELSGVMRQSAEHLYSKLDTSFIGLHVGDWRDQLAVIKNSRGLPAVEDIERLWELFLRQILVQSQQLRFDAEVIYADGRSKQHEVVNIGPFTAIAEGQFLSYLPESRRFVMLDRQPASRYLKAAQSYTDQTGGIVSVPLDPSRGVLLSLLISSPTIAERIEQGGLVAYLILVIGIIGVLLSAARIFSLSRAARAIKIQAADPAHNSDNPLGRIFSVYRDNINAGLETLELKLDEKIIGEATRFDRGISILKVFAIIAPMLGLLGTVTGMIETFQSITLFGTGDPKLMSSGISQALVTTALGLIVAIPIMLLHTYISTESRNLKEILEEQSVGLMAEYARIKDTEK